MKQFLFAQAAAPVEPAAPAAPATTEVSAAPAATETDDAANATAFVGPGGIGMPVVCVV